MNDEKNDYTKNEIRNANNDQNKMWKCLKKLLPNKRTITKTSDEISFNGNKFSEATEICENFNKFFVKSIIDINNQIPDAKLRIHVQELNCNFRINAVQIDDIMRIMKSLTIVKIRRKTFL